MIGLDFFEGARGADVDLRHLLLGKKTIFKTLHRENGILIDVLKKIVEEKSRDDEYSRLAVFALVGELISILLRGGTDSSKTPPSEDMIHRYTTIEPAIRSIRDNYRESFSIDELSKLCAVSKYHFCRIFKEVMGMSPIRYINYYRLKIADAMLQNSDKSINEIAEDTGFEDASYFSKLYKKTFGNSPRSAKRKM
jgi:transcriptional regulator GlxA family with amidase domain